MEGGGGVISPFKTPSPIGISVKVEILDPPRIVLSRAGVGRGGGVGASSEGICKGWVYAYSSNETTFGDASFLPRKEV